MCIIDCLSTIVFILPLHLDYTKVIILILWWRNFQLEYWRTFQLVSTNIIGKTCVRKQKIRHRLFQGAGIQWYKIQYFSKGMNLYGIKLFIIRTFLLFPKTKLYDCRTFWLSCLFVKGVDTSAYTVRIAFHRGKRPVLLWQSRFEKMPPTS